MNIKDLQEKVFAIDLIFLSAIKLISLLRGFGWLQSPSTTLELRIDDSIINL